MHFTTYDLYAMQLLHFFIVSHGYQIVRVQQHKEDIWLMNPNQEHYPVLRISSKSNAGTVTDSEYIRNVHRIILNLIHREGPIMVFNTNPDATLVANPIITQIKVTKGGISDRQILKIFPGLDHILHDTNDEQEEFANISKQIEEAQLKQQKQTIAKAKKAAIPKITMLLMCMMSLVFIATTIMTLISKDAALGVISTGGYYKMNITAAHEYYRIVSAGFVHSDIFQLLMHLFVFYQIGKLCERMYSKGSYMIIFMASIMLSNIFLYIGEGNIVSFGMTAGIYGLIMAYGVALIINGSWRLPLVRISLFKIIWFAFLLLFVSGVPIIGLLGGMLAGLILGIILNHPKRQKELVHHMTIAGACLLAVMIYLMIQVKHVQPLQKELDANIMELYRNTPMNSYADYLQSCYRQQYGKE